MCYCLLSNRINARAIGIRLHNCHDRSVTVPKLNPSNLIRPANDSFLKWGDHGVPLNIIYSILVEFYTINHPFWGTPIYGSPHIEE